MQPFLTVLVSFFVLFWPLTTLAQNTALPGYSQQSSTAEREWEQKFRQIASAENIRQYNRRLSARPHNVGSPYDKDNAEWILSQFENWGLDAHIETFEVLYPTPKSRKLELLGPKPYTAKLATSSRTRSSPASAKSSSRSLFKMAIWYGSQQIVRQSSTRCRSDDWRAMAKACCRSMARHSRTDGAPHSTARLLPHWCSIAKAVPWHRLRSA